MNKITSLCGNCTYKGIYMCINKKDCVNQSFYQVGNTAFKNVHK